MSELLLGTTYVLAGSVTVVYLGYWVYRGFRRMRSNGQPVERGAQILSPGWSKAVHVVGAVVSAATLAWILFWFALLMWFSDYTW